MPHDIALIEALDDFAALFVAHCSGGYDVDDPTRNCSTCDCFSASGGMA